MGTSRSAGPGSKALFAMVEQHVGPLVAATPDGRPTGQGTAFLATLDDRNVVISAAHVLSSAGAFHFFAHGVGFVPLGGLPAIPVRDQGTPTAWGEPDAALLATDDTTTHAELVASRKQFWPIMLATPRHGALAFTVGYPAEFRAVRPDGLKPEPTIGVGRIEVVREPGREQCSHGANPDWHALLRLRRGGRLEDLAGASGAPVFQLPSRGRCHREDLRLVGVFDSQDGDVLRFTNAAVLRSILRRRSGAR